MKELNIKGSARATGRKADVKAVRRAGLVPCNIYGAGIENLSFAITVKDLESITNTPYSHIINLDIDGNTFKAILGEVQYHPVKDNAIHADFIVVTEDKPVAINVPLAITGNSEGVKLRGKLVVSCRKLRVSALLKNLPDELPVDITTLKIGKRINAGDLEYDNVTILSPKTTIICTINSTRNAAVEASAE